MQQIQLELLPVVAPKKQGPAMIRVTKAGNFITLNSSFVDNCEIDFKLEPYRMGLSFDKAKPLDWYLMVIHPGTELNEWEKKAFTEIRMLKGGSIQFKAPNHVRKFLKDFAIGDTVASKIECPISINALPQFSTKSVFAIITKTLIK